MWRRNQRTYTYQLQLRFIISSDVFYRWFGALPDWLCVVVFLFVIAPLCSKLHNLFIAFFFSLIYFLRISVFVFIVNINCFKQLTSCRLKCTNSRVVFVFTLRFNLFWQSFTKQCSFLYYINAFSVPIMLPVVGKRQVHS